jgi:hypothetical protein
MTRRALAAAGAILALVASRSSSPAVEARADAATRGIEAPAPPGSLTPSLASTADGRVLLSWLEPRGERGHALRFASRTAGAGWSEPRTVASGEGWFVNWADFPHLAALPDGTLYAHWLEKRAQGGTYDYDVRITRSRDAGRTWEAPFAPYADRTAGEHGFVALAPLDTTRMGALFLDGRETKRQNGAMTLRFAAVPRTGAPEPDARLDERVCDCCQTALARTTRGLVAAYRDRAADEVRDIAVVRFVDGRWSAPAVPAADGWQIHGCPVNGPALAADGDRVALAWFTMANETPRVKLAFSEDAGASWSKPQVVDDGKPIGRVDVVLPRAARSDAGGAASAVVSWLEQTEAGASVRVRRVSASGGARPSLAVAGTSVARSSGFPRLAVAGDGLIVAWRDAAEPPRIHTALVDLP